MMCFRDSERYARKGAGLLCLIFTGVCLGMAQSASNPPRSSHSSAPARQMPAPPAKGQQTFAHAQQAVDAFVAAIKANDTAALNRVLGPDATDVLSSGDPTQDGQERQQFLDKYRQMHRMVTEPDGLTTLFVGAENWPEPIPLARHSGAWYFDTPAGEREILYRRIGQNELTVIQVCGELAAAEKEYDAQPRGGTDTKQYAQRLMSSPGEQNGLYWKAGAGEPRSPLGPFVAAAALDGYPTGSSPQRTPFHGYYFRLLKAQGPDAPGGAESYVVNGKMTRGFAFLAFPAEYRSSGVMTFQVDSDGVVYQKDLGPKTAELAKAMAAYDVNSAWQKADDTPSASGADSASGPSAGNN